MNIMNIIKCRQEERAKKIGIIQDSLKKSEAWNRGELKKPALILMFMANMGMSKRTISEYLDLAIFNIQHGI